MLNRIVTSMYYVEYANKGFAYSEVHTLCIPSLYQRNFMRFFWFKDNNPDNPLVHFRANVHIFGNKSSPSVAIAGLRKAADTLTKTTQIQ